MFIPQKSWSIFLWPGLPQLTKRGTWSALFWALATAFLADGVVITRYIWPETFSNFWDNIILGAFIGIYFVGCYISWHLEKNREESAPQNKGDEFPAAQALYLKGRYFEAEKILQNQLKREPEDMASQILLLDLLVVTRRLDEAQQQLESVLNIPDSRAWSWELLDINERIKQVREDLLQEEQTDTNVPCQNQNETPSVSVVQTEDVSESVTVPYPNAEQNSVIAG